MAYWLIIIVFFALVGCGYWFFPEAFVISRWGQRMSKGVASDPNSEPELGPAFHDDPLASDTEEPQPMDSDSYIVAVRTLTPDPTEYAPENDDGPLAPYPEDLADAHWEAYKRSFERPLTDPDTPLEPLANPVDEASDQAEDNTGQTEDQNDPQPVGSAEAAAQAHSPNDESEATEIERYETQTSDPGEESQDVVSEETEVADDTNNRPDTQFEPSPQTEPVLTDIPDPSIEPQPRLDDQQALFVIHAYAGHENPYQGSDIHAALVDQGLIFGFGGLYHQVVEHDGHRISAFAVASMVNPGTLDPVERDTLVTPGLALFMVAPGTESAPANLRHMMETAHALTVSLGGTVLDDQHDVLTADTARRMLHRADAIDRQSSNQPAQALAG